MRTLILIFFTILISCSQISNSEVRYELDLPLLQEVWESKNPELAFKKIKGLKLIKDEKEFKTLGIPRESGFSPLTIFVLKKTNKINSMGLSVLGRGKADFIKSQIKASDWKTIERPIKDHPLRHEISEYSVSKDVSFLYEKGDPKKEVNVIYWGSDPKKINW